MSKEKYGILKGKTKGKQGKTVEREEEKDFKERASGGTKELKPLNCRKIGFWGLFKKNKTKQNKTNPSPPPKKKEAKKNLFTCWQTTPILGKFLFLTCTLLFLQAVSHWKHYENRVLSRTQLLCITDRKKKNPFEDPSENTPFQTKSDILGCPLCPPKPLFL